VTDYGSSMVQWVHTRRPRYKSSHKTEAERPSASYAVDVRAKVPCQVSSQLMVLSDASSFGQNPLPCRYNSCPTFTPIHWQIKKAHHGCEMDTGGQTAVNGWTYWRVYVVEWNGFQFRDRHGRASSPTPRNHYFLDCFVDLESRHIMISSKPG
jgi:hypothetical protein